MKSYKRFEGDLRANGYDITMFWQAQYSLWISGYRGVKLHDATYIFMEAE